MASTTVPTARPGERVKIAPRLYEYGRKDGQGCSYYADVVLDGRQTRRKLEATTRTAARQEQTNLSSDNQRGLVAAPTKLTLGEVADEWLAQVDVKPRSREAYELQLRKNVLPRLGTRPIQGIKPKDCTALLRWLRDDRELSAATQTSALNVLRAVFKHAVIEEYIVANPVDRIARKAPKQKKIPHRYLSPVELANLLEHTNGYRPLFETLAFAGLRCAEAMGLIWSDIDLTEGTIHVQAQLARSEPKRVPTKTDEERIVNIDSGLVVVLREHKTKALALGRAGGEQFVFQTSEGTVFAYQSVWKAFQVAATKAGLNEDEEGRKLRIHDLRRTYASILLNDGQPAAYVAKQLGHTVDVLFRTYAGLIENQAGQHRERQLAAVESFRSGAS